jgi:hypothetical protein
MGGTPSYRAIGETVHGMDIPTAFSASTENIRPHVEAIAVRSQKFIEEHLHRVVSEIIPVQYTQKDRETREIIKMEREYWRISAATAETILTVHENINALCQATIPEGFLSHLLTRKQTAIAIVATFLYTEETSRDISSTTSPSSFRSVDFSHEEEEGRLEPGKRPRKGKERVIERQKSRRVVRPRTRSRDDVGAFKLFIPRYNTDSVSLEIGCTFPSYGGRKISMIMNAIVLEMCRLSGIRYATAQPVPIPSTRTFVSRRLIGNLLGFTETPLDVLSCVQRAPEGELSELEVEKLAPTPFFLLFRTEEGKLKDYAYLDLWNESKVRDKTTGNPVDYRRLIPGLVIGEESRNLYDSTDTVAWAAGTAAGKLCNVIPLNYLLDIYSLYRRIMGQKMIKGLFIYDSRFELADVDEKWKPVSQEIEEEEERLRREAEGRGQPGRFGMMRPPGFGTEMKSKPDPIYSREQLYKSEAEAADLLITDMRKQLGSWKGEQRESVLQFALCKEIALTAMKYRSIKELIISIVKVMLADHQPKTTFGMTRYNGRHVVLRDLWDDYNKALLKEYGNDFKMFRRDKREESYSVLMDLINQLEYPYPELMYTLMERWTKPMFYYSQKEEEDIDHTLFVRVLTERIYTKMFLVTPHETDIANKVEVMMAESLPSEEPVEEKQLLF